MPPAKPKVANVDGQKCVVATCGARAAKSWWWRQDADGSRSWCCRGDDGAAHRAVLASDGWQLSKPGKDVLPPLPSAATALMRNYLPPEQRKLGFFSGASQEECDAWVARDEEESWQRKKAMVTEDGITSVEELEAWAEATRKEARDGGWRRFLCTPPVEPTAYLCALVARGDEHQWGCAHARAVYKVECPTCSVSTQELRDAWVAEAAAVEAGVRSLTVTLSDVVLRPSSIEFRLSVSGGDADAAPLSVGSMMASLRERGKQHEVDRGSYAHAWWDVATWPPSARTVFELPGTVDGGATVAQPGDVLDVSLLLKALSEREEEAAKLLGIDLDGKVSGVALNEWNVSATVRLPARARARTAASAHARDAVQPSHVWGHAERLEVLCTVDAVMRCAENGTMTRIHDKSFE